MGEMRLTSHHGGGTVSSDYKKEAWIMVTIKDVNEATGVLPEQIRDMSEDRAGAIIASAIVLGDTIVEEMGLTPSQVADLPDGTVLGPRAEAAFRTYGDALRVERQ